MLIHIALWFVLKKFFTGHKHVWWIDHGCYKPQGITNALMELEAFCVTSFSLLGLICLLLMKIFDFFVGPFLQQFLLQTACSKRLWRSEEVDKKGEWPAHDVSFAIRVARPVGKLLQFQIFESFPPKSYYVKPRYTDWKTWSRWLWL